MLLLNFLSTKTNKQANAKAMFSWGISIPQLHDGPETTPCCTVSTAAFLLPVPSPPKFWSTQAKKGYSLRFESPLKTAREKQVELVLVMYFI